ncbi:MAG TPA: sulfatase-like hydrolase/transferase [Terriglobales bacterium]|nr:sulfatase-like hydrolase/transferase [Terriglobales bacterium]
MLQNPGDLAAGLLPTHNEVARSGTSVRLGLSTIAKAIWGTYSLLTSVYCLLAFLPYTYVGVIKEPPYEWVTWFSHHQAILYLVALAGLLLTEGRKQTLLIVALSAAGVYLALRPFLPAIQDNWAAYAWSLASLAPLMLVAGCRIREHWPEPQTHPAQNSLLSYSGALLIAAGMTAIYTTGAAIHTSFLNRPLRLTAKGAELTVWSLLSHMVLAILLISVLNLIRVVSAKRQNWRAWNLVFTGTLAWLLLWGVTARFLHTALSFEGWASHVFAACFTMAIVLWGLWLAVPSWAGTENQSEHKVTIGTVATVMAMFAIVLPTIIAGGDWDGLLQGSFTLIFWLAAGWCVYRLWPRRRNYSVVAILTVVVLTGFVYKGLQATEIFWGRPMGSTDDDVARAMENYASDDASFQLVHHFLGNTREEPCGDLCRILRENTNVRNAEVKDDLRLVDELSPAPGPHPNIFFFVVDSLRADYLGAYNPKVDFTPNLDNFAWESVAVHNVYTQYAGTSLSEPAIWAGAMLLHAHYLQPFSKINSLEKLARADGYQVIVSYDEILQQILPDPDIKLDTNIKIWNQLELCSTIRQVEPLVMSHTSHQPPILFYTQPKNVHQFAHNNLPMIKDDHWRMRDGFNNRIAHEVSQVDSCLGNFFSFLKSHDLYDNSIIIVTSDHGDSTGEFGRYSHSLSIYPEVMRVPLLVHLPAQMRQKLRFDDSHLSALTDITPSLYYLLGHRPIRANPLYGHPIFVDSDAELRQNQRQELFLASDERAVFGLLTENGRLLYATYDSPAQSFLFDLSRDPNAEHNLVDATAKKQYDEEIIRQLHLIADFYGYKPGVGALLSASR